MKKVSRIWLWLFLVMVGYSGGIVTGVVVDVDSVYHTTIEKLKQKNSPGGEIIVDVDTDIQPEKSKKEVRKEEREKRREERQRDRAIRKSVGKKKKP